MGRTGQNPVEVYILRGGDASILASGALKVSDVGGGGSGAVGYSAFVTLSGLNMALTGGASTSVDGIDTSQARHFTLAGNVAKTGTPTDIVLEVRFTTNTGTAVYFPYQNDFWGDLRWDDTAIGSGFPFALHGEVDSDYVSIYAEMSGSNTVTLSNMTLFLKD